MTVKEAALKLVRAVILLTILTAIMVGSVSARKMPVSAYITSAKIEIISGDLERYPTAIGYLDSLFLYYGHHSEGLYWMAQIYVDYIEKAPDLAEKKEHVVKMVAYRDTLRMTCENQDIKKKFRKKCDEFVGKMDSTAVKYWREFYNAAIEHLQEIRVVAGDMKSDPDSASQEYYRSKLDAYADSCQTFMGIVLDIDSADHRPYVGIASLHEQKEEYAEANNILEKGLAYAGPEDRPDLLLQVVNNYFRAGDYCPVIPYLKEYCDSNRPPVEADPSWTPEQMEIAQQNLEGWLVNAQNLASVYNRCHKYDSAVAVYRDMADLAPSSIDALTGIGQYFNQMGIFYSDSSRQAVNAGDSATGKAFLDKQREMFDTSKAYFAQAYELAPDDKFVTEEYAVLLYLTGDFQTAIEPFANLTEIEPHVPDHWTSLGDCYLKTQQFDKSARAYEKVVEINPDNIPIWESLELLYKELGETENLAKAQEKLKN
jgi:tetratricopeptide (TPR) repeat protein